MSLYTIGDLHLHFQSPLKARAQQQERVWKNHEEVVRRTCAALLTPEDTLVLVGRHQCGQTSPQYLPIHVTIGLAVEQVTQQEGVRLFPNPTQGSVTLELRSYESWENPRWMLCDMQGRLLESGTVESMQTHIRLDALPRGVYMVRVVSAGSRQCSMKVVKY